MQDESYPTTIWVSLHVAQLCCCGHSFKSLTTVPKQNTAYTVFYPPWGGHIYVDPDLKSFIQPAQKFKNMVDSLSGSHPDISTAASPQLYVALNSTLQFITSDMATNHTFRCHFNECAHNLMQSFQEISNREQVLIATYREIAALKMQPLISPTPQPVPNPPVQSETNPSDALLTARTRKMCGTYLLGSRLLHWQLR